MKRKVIFFVTVLFAFITSVRAICNEDMVDVQPNISYWSDKTVVCEYNSHTTGSTKASRIIMYSNNDDTIGIVNYTQGNQTPEATLVGCFSPIKNDNTNYLYLTVSEKSSSARKLIVEGISVGTTDTSIISLLSPKFENDKMSFSCPKFAGMNNSQLVLSNSEDTLKSRNVVNYGKLSLERASTLSPVETGFGLDESIPIISVTTPTIPTPIPTPTPIENTKYKVTFNIVINGNTQIYKTVTVEKGNLVNKPENPVIPGKIFLTWLNENGNEYDFKSGVYADIQLTAKLSNDPNYVISFGDEHYAVSEYVYNYKKESGNSSTQTETQFVGSKNLCEMSGTLKALKILREVVHIIKICVPLALIIIGSIEFGKAVASNDNDSIPKTTKSLITRIGIGVAIFFIPIIIDSFVNLINGYDSLKNSFVNCQVCFFGDKDHSYKTCDNVIKGAEIGCFSGSYSDEKKEACDKLGIIITKVEN